jgi:serine/threonine protein kinase
LGICPECLLKAGLESKSRTDGEPNHPPPAITVGEVAIHFPQLEIIELLGQGGMGVVFKARQSQLDRLVALKVMLPEFARESSFAERFTREARILARLNHPNIVTVYDFGQTGGFFYFLMEFVEGVNLRQSMQSGRLTPEQALTIVPRLCDALQFAHDEGVTHRDIKPENILLDRRGRVKMADFGLAKLTGEAQTDFSITATGVTMGTPKYMAPEQLENAKSVDHRADIYSLGVVFYEMLTGELPLGRFEPPSQRVQVDVRLDEIVLKALEKRPERRYQQASEVKTQVESIAGKPQASRIPPPAVPVETKPGDKNLAETPPGHSEFRQQDAREILALVMAVLSGLSIVGVVAGVIGLARVIFPALRTDMQLGPAEALGRDAFQFGGILVLSLMALFLLPKARRQGRDRLARINALNLVIVGAFLTFACSRHWFGLTVPYWLGGIYAVFAFVCWILLRGRDVRAAFESVPITPQPTPSPRHFLSACLALLCLFGFFFGFSFQAKYSAGATGQTKLITVGALDPLFVSQSGAAGFSTNLNFFSWSFFAVVVAGVAFGALWRIGREDQGKVPRDPAWWRDWWKQVGVWGGLLLIVCIVRTVMHPEKVLQSPGERTAALRLMGLFSSGPEFHEDPSRIPATRTAGRTDYAYAFSVPANHRLYVWIEWWKGGERTIDRDCNTAYVARRGDRLERNLQVIFNDGTIAGPSTKGQVRIDWLFDDGKGNSTSGRWRPNFFEGLATSVDLNRVKSWKPKVGETVNLLEIRGGKDSIDGNPVTEERLRAGRWEAVMILRARVEAVPESRKWEGTITSFNAWNDNEEPSPTLLRLGETFGAVLGPFTDARNLRDQITDRIRRDAGSRAKVEQMLKDAGVTFAADEKPDGLVKKLESIPAKAPAAPKEPLAAPLAPAQDLRFAIQQDRSQLPASPTPGRQDYAFKFAGPADHTLNVWMEVWQEGKMEWVSDFDFEARPKAGEPVAAFLTLIAMGGDAASKESKGKTRLHWAMTCSGSEGITQTANALIADLSAGMGATYSTWDRQLRPLNPRPGETVTVLGITGYKLSNFRSVVPGFTETDLLKRWPNAAVLVRARFSPARPGQLSDAVGLDTKVSDQAFARRTFAQFQISKQLGVDLSDCRTRMEAHAALVAAASTPDGSARAAQMVDELGSDNIGYADHFKMVAEPLLAMWWKLRKKEPVTAEEVVTLLENFITALNGPGSYSVWWHHGEPITKWAAGPYLNDSFAKKLKLTKLQVDEVNKLFKKYADEASALGRRHTKVTKNDQGHVIVTTEPYSVECLELARKMVAELGGIVTQDIVPAVKVGALPTAIFGIAGECRETTVLKKDAKGVYVIEIRRTDWVNAHGSGAGNSTTSWGSTDIGLAFGSYKMYWSEE